MGYLEPSEVVVVVVGLAPIRLAAISTLGSHLSPGRCLLRVGLPWW